jgi:tetratricopeptide (TPR) repeat protein
MKCLLLVGEFRADAVEAQHAFDVVECIVRPALARLGLELLEAQSATIEDRLDEADAIVAVLHGASPKVAFGLGLAVARGKPVVAMRCEDDEAALSHPGLSEVVYNLKPQAIFRSTHVTALAATLRHALPASAAGREAAPALSAARADAPAVKAAGTGCFMAQGLYLKANLEMPCWDDVGEEKILRRLDPQLLLSGQETALSAFDALLHIRSAFARGRTPHPGYCERCAVRTQGRPVTEMRPRTLEVLHVEPSYLCHLACPQCIQPKDRKSLKGPPYHLDPDVYDAFLAQLAREVQHIRLLMFEGRGDPLNNKRMGELVRATKRHFPRTFTSITSHGNFPFKPWMMDCGLDELRLSVDGAFQDNYAKYRVGGRLDSALKLMRDIRDFDDGGRGKPEIEWKYILFEWNDSDEELKKAGELAQELGVRLRFCRTHTPGRSRRFESAESMQDLIAGLAPEARGGLTFQLRATGDVAGVEDLLDRKIEGLFAKAIASLERGDAVKAQASVDDALALDSGLDRENTVAWMMNYASRVGNLDLKIAMGRRYLELNPHAMDAGGVRSEIFLCEAFLALRDGDTDLANARIDAALAPDLGSRRRWLDELAAAAATRDPGQASALANIAREVGDLAAAVELFRRYLALAPDAPDRQAVLDTVSELEAAAAMNASILVDP